MRKLHRKARLDFIYRHKSPDNVQEYECDVILSLLIFDVVFVWSLY